METSIILEAETFPLAFRSDGSFLEADTPKAAVAGSSSNFFSCYHEKRGASPCKPSPATAPAHMQLPASPLFLSPSKSYSDAISATADFSTSLRNFFAMDKSQLDEARKTSQQGVAGRSGGRALKTMSVACQEPEQPQMNARSHLLFNALAPIHTNKGVSASKGATFMKPPNQIEEAVPEMNSPYSSMLSVHLTLPEADLTGLVLPDPNLGGAANMAWADSLAQIHLQKIDDAVMAGPQALPFSSTLGSDSASAEAEPAPSQSQDATVFHASRRRVASVSVSDHSASENGGAVDGNSMDQEEENLEEEEDEEEEEELMNRAQKKLKTTKGASKKNALNIHRSASRLMCLSCKTTSTPQWREGPGGARTLCNACGLRYRKGLLTTY